MSIQLLSAKRGLKDIGGGPLNPEKKILSLGSQWEGEKYNPKNEKNFNFRVVFFLISLATKWRGHFSVNLNLEN